MDRLNLLTGITGKMSECLTDEAFSVLHDEGFIPDYVTSLLGDLASKLIRYKNMSWGEASKIILKQSTVREILGDGTFIPASEARCMPEFGFDGMDLIHYYGGLHIFVNEDSYSLVIESSEWESQCLFDLEERLAEYAVDAGIFDRDEYGWLCDDCNDEFSREDSICTEDGIYCRRCYRDRICDGAALNIQLEEYRGHDYGDDE